MTIFDALQSEILSVEETLDTLPHKARRSLALYRCEIERAFQGLPGTHDQYERIGVCRLMLTRVLSQLLAQRSAKLAAREVISYADSHLLQLLFSAGRRFADSTDELEAEFGPLDFSSDLPERIAAEFQIDANEAWTDACHIRASRVYTERHREEILAQAEKVGLL